MNAQPKILIIGAGLAGLSLGQGLKKSGIPFKIYERDTSASFRAQGYRIRINSDGAGALRRLFPDPLWQVFEATCAEVVPGGHRLDAKSGQAVKWSRPAPPQNVGAAGSKWKPAEGKAYNADRAVLRNTLLVGLEEQIEFGKRFLRYQITAEGEVVAHFADGSSARGRFLVGADGIRSVVRRQLLPDFALLDTEGRAVFGKTEVTHELTSQLAAEVGDGITLIGESEESRMKLFCDSMRWNQQDAIASGQEVGIEIPPDYIYWVFVFRKDVLPESEESALSSLSNQDSVRLSHKLASNWSDKLQILFKLQKPDAASTLTFLTAPMDFEAKWAVKSSEVRERVTLIGDSGHPMPPVGGVGANAGFQDAAELLEALLRLDETSEHSGRGKVLSEYEQTMLQRAAGSVQVSASGAGNFFGMKPLAELKTAAEWH